MPQAVTVAHPTIPLAQWCPGEGSLGLGRVFMDLDARAEGRGQLTLLSADSHAFLLLLKTPSTLSSASQPPSPSLSHIPQSRADHIPSLGSLGKLEPLLSVFWTPSLVL